MGTSLSLNFARKAKDDRLLVFASLLFATGVRRVLPETMVCVLVGRLCLQ